MREPKILLWDIETTPVKCWIFRTGKQFINHKSIVEGERFEIICIAYKWSNQKKVNCLTWDKNQNSAKMVQEFVEVLESSDVAIGQNADSFDVKQLNTQRMLHGQPPIAWPTTEDTRKQIKRHFYVTSSSLEYMSKLLTGSGKDRMEFDDWIDIVDKKSSKALAKMVKYCKKDVKKLEEVWNRIAPYVTVKASRARIMGIKNPACPKCGSPRVQKRGQRFLMSSTKQRYTCYSCLGSFETILNS